MNDERFFLNETENNFRKNKVSARFLQHRRKTFIFVDGRKIATYNPFKTKHIDSENLSKREILRFFGVVRKEVNTYIKDCDYSIEDIKQLNLTTKGFNYDVFKELSVGESFWAYDLNSAYWQIMYRLGIIKKGIYEKYKTDRRYRRYKQMSIGLVNASKKCRYMIEGDFVRDCDSSEMIIEEYNEQWKQVYKNVRVACYNVPVSIAEFVNNHYIFYNQDAIAVPLDLSENVKSFLDDNELEYKMQLCEKVSDFEYTLGKDTRRIPTFYASESF